MSNFFTEWLGELKEMAWGIKTCAGRGNVPETLSLLLRVDAQSLPSACLAGSLCLWLCGRVSLYKCFLVKRRRKLELAVT